MTAALQRLLFTIVISLILVDLAWGFHAHFQVDTVAYAQLGLMSLALLAGGIYYQGYRDEPQLAAMLLGAGFLCAFSAAASVLNYFLLTLHGPRIDDILVSADRALGFDWYATMVAMSHHVILNEVFFRVYNLVLPQIALVLVGLAWTGQVEKVYRYCLALAVGALIAIFIWALIPSLGAKSLYTLPPEVAGRLSLSVTTDYGRDLVRLFRDGPGFISPTDLRGLIAFPSYHGVLALIVTFYAWSVRGLRWPVLVTNAAVLISTPVQGGHHLVDVLAAFPVTALALFIVARTAAVLKVGKSPALVNKATREGANWAPSAPFCAVLEQKPKPNPSAIKRKLNAVP